MSTQTPPSAGAPAAAGLAYAGLRVLDVSQGLAGPYCGALLAQYGAQVIKLEPPEGDWSRGVGTRHGSHTALDLMANRGKQSIAVNLKDADALAMVRRIAAQCDVMIESYRPGIAARLGIGYADLARENDKLIYVSISGFGQSGDKSTLPATDTVMQGFSGMMPLTPDPQGKPQRLGFLAIDTLTALYAFQAVSVALYARRDGASGRHLDISLMQATAAFLTPKIIETSLEGAAPPPINAPAGVYRTQDGWIALTLSKEPHFAALCKATNLPALASDPRYASFQLRAPHVRELERQLQAVLDQNTSEHWLSTLAAHGVIASRVNTLTDWLADPHVLAVGVAPPAQVAGRELRLPVTPGLQAPDANDPRARWPDVGVDGARVLREFGFSESEVAALRASGAFIQSN